VKALTAAQLDGMTAAQLAAFTPEQVASLSKEMQLKFNTIKTKKVRVATPCSHSPKVESAPRDEWRQRVPYSDGNQCESRVRRCACHAHSPPYSDAKVANRDRPRGRFTTPADFPRHDCSPYSHAHVRRERVGVVHRSRDHFLSPPCQTLTFRFATFRVVVRR
jgi:hypothetical protein